MMRRVANVSPVPDVYPIRLERIWPLGPEGDIEFEDLRLTFAEFGEARRSFRFKAVPVLEIDDQAVTQSNALARYVGKLVGLYPTDDLQALYCDEAMDAVEDLSHAIGT
jgi:hypothetical protein